MGVKITSCLEILVLLTGNGENWRQPNGMASSKQSTRRFSSQNLHVYASSRLD